MQAWIGDATEVIDCHGKSVIPGLGDAHQHNAQATLKLGTYSFSHIVPNPETDTPEDVVKRIQETLGAYAEEHKDAPVIRGFGWDRAWFIGSLQGIVRPFTRHDIDAVISDKPVVLMSFCGHLAMLNTKALEAAGVAKDTDDQGGLMGKNHIIASNQPGGFSDNPTTQPVMATYWGEDVVRQIYPSKSLIDNGVMCAYGSDFPVNPAYGLAGIQVAMTRKQVKIDPTYEFYKDVSPAIDAAFIAENCIEGKPYVSEVPVAPDETGAMLRGMNTAQTSPTEGDAYFDIYFNAVVPGTGEVIQLIVNVEMQADYYPGYPLPKRGIYYCSRMISAQNGTVFEGSEYGRLRKVYSIWVCMNPPKKWENSINCYEMKERNIIGKAHEKVENYDLITLVMIHLGNETGENYSGVLKLLGTLFTSGATVEAKKQILQDEFDIPMTRTIEKEVSSMGGSFFDAAIARGENRGYERGIQRGVEQGLLFSAQRLIKKEGWPFDRAMALLDVPQEQWKNYAAQMEQKSD